MDRTSIPLRLFPDSPHEGRASSHDNPVTSISPSRLSRPTRGVLFDMCNILYDDTVWRRWLLRLLSQVGLHTSYRSFFHIWDCDCLSEVYVGRKRFSDAFGELLRSVGMSRGQIEELQAASRSRRRSMEDSLRALPGVKATIAKLAESGIVLGAVCNSEFTGSELRDRIDRLGLARHFAGVVSSIDVGTAMPQLPCYWAGLKEIGLMAEEVVFVGHDAAQLAGATAAGMSTIALNFDDRATADVYLNRIEDLIAVLSPPKSLAAAG